jgi:hypothetical protein
MGNMITNAERKFAYAKWLVLSQKSDDIRVVMKARLDALKVDREIALKHNVPGVEVYSVKIERITKALNSLTEAASLDVTRDYVA